MSSVNKQGEAGTEPQLYVTFPLWKLPKSTTKYTKQFLNHQFTASCTTFLKNDDFSHLKHYIPSC